MKYFVIFYIDCKNPSEINEVKLPSTLYSTQEEANGDLLKTALNFVKEEQGKQQADITVQNDKTLEELLNRENIKEGLYIKLEPLAPTKVDIYSKYKETIPGKYWGNTQEMKISKIGIFGITDIELNLLDGDFFDEKIPQAPTIIQTLTVKSSGDFLSKRSSLRPIKKQQMNICYLDELREVLSKNNFGLKSKHPLQKEKEDSLEGDCDYYNNYDN